MSITAIVENDSIKLPVHVPDGTPVEIHWSQEKGESAETENPLGWLCKHAGSIDGPSDWAAEHDHYLHGTPKRAGR